MRRRVRVAAQFRDDVASHIRWLLDHDEIDRVARLRSDLQAARQLVARFPFAGTIESSDEDVTVRRLILRTVPFVVWFAVGRGPRGDVTLLRLFHARQARPRRVR